MGRRVDNDKIRPGLLRVLKQPPKLGLCGRCHLWGFLLADFRPLGRAALRVEVNDARRLAVMCGTHGKVHGNGGFSTAALLGDDGEGFHSGCFCWVLLIHKTGVMVYYRLTQRMPSSVIFINCKTGVKVLWIKNISETS